MKRTVSEELSKSSNVKVSRCSFIDVAGDYHAHYNLNEIATHAGIQLRLYSSYVFLTLIVNHRLSMANDIRPFFEGCCLQFPGARSNSSMSSWNAEESIGEDRNVGQSW